MKKRKLYFIIATLIMLTLAKNAFAATPVQTVFPTQTNAVTIMNNYVGTPDQIILGAGCFKKDDVIKVYRTSNTSDSTIMGQTAIADPSKNNSIVIDQLGQAAGNVFLTVTSADPNNTESKRVLFRYKQEVSPAPNDRTVFIQGNVDIPDTITFENLNKGDVAYVYSGDGKTRLGASIPSTTQGAVTFKLNKHIDMSNPEVFASVKCINALESEKTYVNNYNYPEQTKGLAKNQVIIANTVDTPPYVLFRNLTNKSTVTITYISPKDGKTITKSAIAVINPKKSSLADVTINLPSGALNQTLGGSVDISIREYNKISSLSTDYTYFSALTTLPPNPFNILGTNKAIMVSGLNEGDTIKVYDSSSDLIGKGVVSKGNSYVLVNINNKTNDNKVYITNKSQKMLESDKTQYEISYLETSTDAAISFNDVNLQYAIRAYISKPDGNIYENDVKYLSYFYANECNINDLSGIEKLSNLVYLDLHGNNISDISQLKDLNMLRYLYIGDNKITEISSLKYLSNLEVLDIKNNEINDISPLADMKSLKTISISGNQISNMTKLSEMTNLGALFVINHQLTDTNLLKNLKNLTVLSISSGKLNDLNGLKDLNKLSVLCLDNNNITDITPLSSLTGLTYLSLSGNKISDISTLKELKNLKTLFLNGNNISSKDIENLKSALPQCYIY